MKRLSILPFVASLTLMQGAYAAGDKETQLDVANRIALDGSRAADRGDAKGVKEAERASRQAREAKTVQQARQIEKNYNKDNFN